MILNKFHYLIFKSILILFLNILTQKNDFFIILRFCKGPLYDIKAIVGFFCGIFTWH